MQSMTGYGKAEYHENGITLTVEIKTVNNRFLDVIPKYPRNFVQFDDLIRKTVQEKLSRGRVELFVSYENLTEGGVTLVVNQSLAGEYVKAADELSKKFGVVNDLTAVLLMRLPDVATQSVAEEDSAALGEILKSTLNRALDALNEMRKVEGEKLANDVYSHSVTRGKSLRKSPRDKDGLRKQTARAYGGSSRLGDLRRNEAFAGSRAFCR